MLAAHPFLILSTHHVCVVYRSGHTVVYTHETDVRAWETKDVIPILLYKWMHLMVLSLRRTVFFLLACPGMMKVLAMYLPTSVIPASSQHLIKNHVNHHINVISTLYHHANTLTASNATSTTGSKRYYRPHCIDRIRVYMCGVANIEQEKKTGLQYATQPQSA